MAGGGGDQAIQQIGGLQFVAPAELLDDALDVPPALAGVLDEVEVFVATDLLDADVTAQLSQQRSHEPQSGNQSDGIGHEGLEHTPTLLARGG